MTAYAIQICKYTVVGHWDPFRRLRRNVIFKGVVFVQTECCSLWLSRYFCWYKGVVSAKCNIQYTSKEKKNLLRLKFSGFAIKLLTLFHSVYWGTLKCNKHFKNFLVSSWVKLLTVIVNISLLISLGQNALYTYSYLILPMIL